MNRYYLRDGRNFIKNPELEAVPGKAREEKVEFIACINPTDFKTDKSWNTEALRALATGLVQPTANGKRLTKTQLADALNDYVEFERNKRLAAAVKTAEVLQDAGYDAELAIKLITTVRGTELVSALTNALLLPGYAETTIVKNYKPKLIRLINQYYEEADREFVIAGLHNYFAAMVKRVNDGQDRRVAGLTNEQRALKLMPMIRFAEKVLNDPNATWKHLLTALVFTTGRRPAEICGVATKFEKADNGLIFTGQLKTKGRDCHPYWIPTVLPVDLVLWGYERLQRLGKTKYVPLEFDRKCSKETSTRMPDDIKAMYQSAGTSRLYDCRTAYALFHLLRKPDGISERSYVSTFLGHDEMDLKTGNNYLSYYVTDAQEVIENTSGYLDV